MGIFGWNDEGRVKLVKWKSWDGFSFERCDGLERGWIEGEVWVVGEKREEGRVG